MKEKLIKLAKEKGFTSEFLFNHPYKYSMKEPLRWYFWMCELQQYIRERRGVVIIIDRNASGYMWTMCKSDGGTDLGWSEDEGPNLGGAWNEYNEALEHALFIQLNYDLPKDKETIHHWGNYVLFALKSIK